MLLLAVVVIEYWLTTLPMAVDLESHLSASTGSDLILRDIATDGPILTYSGPPGEAADIRFDRARLSPETLALFQALGFELSAEEGPIAWLTATESASRTIFEVRSRQATGPFPELRLRTLPAVGAKQPQLELESRGAPLEIVIGTPLAPEEAGGRSAKFLVVADRKIQLPGAVPLKMIVPDGAALRARFAYSGELKPVEFYLGSIPVTAADGGALGMRAVGLRKSGVDAGPYAYFACAARGGAIAWGGITQLTAGRCNLADASITATGLQVAAQNLEIGVMGTAWAQRAGKVVSGDVLSRIAQNRVLAGVLLTLNVALVAWLLVEFFWDLRRRTRGSWSGGIFISYRRGDSASQAGRVCDHLVARYGANRVFMDVDSIAPGEDFVLKINQCLDLADILLAVIGKEWLDVRNASGQRRIDDPADYVRTEIALALERGTMVIPVLVEGATMPRAEELPVPLARLAHRNAVQLSDARFKLDMEYLIAALEEEPATSDSEPAAVAGRPSTSSSSWRRGRHTGA